MPKPPLDPEVTGALLKALKSGDAARMSSSLKGLPSKIVAEAVSMLKTRANQAFAKGNYKDAIDLYTQAMTGAPGEKTLYSNRSLAYLRLQDNHAALQDAHEVLKLDSEWVKGHYRKGAALLALGRASEALPYLKRVASELPDDQEARDLLDRAIRDADSDADRRPPAPPSVGMEEGDAVTLPRKVYYPSQSWFTAHPVGQAVQRQLQSYSDLDSPRRLVALLSDRSGGGAGPVGFWTDYLANRAPDLGKRCLMVGSLAGVAPFHVRQEEGAGGEGGTTVVVVERHAWAGHVVRGVVGKNLLLRRRRRREGEGGGEQAVKAAEEEDRVVVSKKRPAEVLEEGEAGGGAFDTLLWLDWDYSLLGSGVVRFMRAARAKGLLSSLWGVKVRVRAMGIQVLPQGPSGVETMLWEAGPAKFELPPEAYRVMTEEVEVWGEEEVAELRPKQQAVTLPAIHEGQVDAVVYWYQLVLPTRDPEAGEVVLSSDQYDSLGRGITYLDPMQVRPGSTPLELTAYRSESQLGFWPLVTARVIGVAREYRLPRWYADMLVDGPRNRAYESAIGKVCKGRRVLDVGSGTGLLAGMAVKAGAAKVLGCEEVPELAHLSTKLLGPDVKIFVKDVRRLKLAMPAEVVVHEVFDSGMLGEGVLHLLQPQATSSTPPPRMLPARAKVWAQLLEERFDEIAGVNVTLLNPYRYQKDYATLPPPSSTATLPPPMSEPFLLDEADFATDGPDTKSLRVGVVRASRDGVVSAVKLWWIAEFGDDGDGGTGTVLDSRDGHWGCAIMYLPEARFAEGERVPLAATRLGAEYSIRMPEDLVSERLCTGTPRADQAWLNAQEQADKTTDEILQRLALGSGRNESRVIFRVAYRLACHPAEFGVEPHLAARFFHAVMRAKKHGDRERMRTQGPPSS